jgi:hypothetical protein
MGALDVLGGSTLAEAGGEVEQQVDQDHPGAHGREDDDRPWYVPVDVPEQQVERDSDEDEHRGHGDVGGHADLEAARLSVEVLCGGGCAAW